VVKPFFEWGAQVRPYMEAANFYSLSSLKTEYRRNRAECGTAALVCELKTIAQRFRTFALYLLPFNFIRYKHLPQNPPIYSNVLG
jgi:hypothetical protein